MRVFLDANILFSAAKSNGAVRRLLQWLLQAGHQCCADGYVVAEARRNLLAKGPQAVGMLDQLLSQIEVVPAVAAASPSAILAWLPEKDRPVLGAVIRIRCDVLLTGDRTHFGTGYGRTFGGVTIHSPRSLVESMLG